MNIKEIEDQIAKWEDDIFFRRNKGRTLQLC